MKYVFSVDAVAVDSDECDNSLDTIQELNDHKWYECFAVLEAGQDPQEPPSSVNFTALDADLSRLRDIHFDHTDKDLANRSFYHSLYEDCDYESSRKIFNLKTFPNFKFEAICMDNGAQRV